MMRWRIILLIFLLTACTSTPATRIATSQLTSTESPSSYALDNTQKLLKFERSGGFAGITGRWTFFEEGNFISAAGEALAFAPEKINSMIELILSLDFSQPQVPSHPFYSCADCFRYKLVVTIKGASYEFVWSDGDEAVQAGLIKILTSISMLIFKATQN